MKELLLPAVSLLPNILIVIIIFTFYSKKKLKELIWMGIAYIVLTFITAFSIYSPLYFQQNAMPVVEIRNLYEKIGVVSIVAQLVLAIGLWLVLSKYPDGNKKSSASNTSTHSDL